MNVLETLKSEHRLILRMIALVEMVIRRIQEEEQVDISFLRTATDFFRRFADEVHHGKEEDVFFSELLKKKLSRTQKSLIEELLDEHRCRREIVAQVVEAADRNERSGDDLNFAGTILFDITTLARIYPDHIAREEGVLHRIARENFSREDWRRIEQRFRKFDTEGRTREYKKLLADYEIILGRSPVAYSSPMAEKAH